MDQVQNQIDTLISVCEDITQLVKDVETDKDEQVGMLQQNIYLMQDEIKSLKRENNKLSNSLKLIRNNLKI